MRHEEGPGSTPGPSRAYHRCVSSRWRQRWPSRQRSACANRLPAYPLFSRSWALLIRPRNHNHHPQLQLKPVSHHNPSPVAQISPPLKTNAMPRRGHLSKNRHQPQKARPIPPRSERHAKRKRRPIGGVGFFLGSLSCSRLSWPGLNKERAHSNGSFPRHE